MREITYAYGAIPHNLMTLEKTQPIPPAITVFSSMFMHGGFLHIAGNMLYLWIFGDNIEDKLGHVRFALFYLFCGIFAAYSYAVTSPDSTTPMIGASGAISGILGAYVLLFPRASVHTLIFLGFFVTTVRIPALIVIGFWAIIQFVSGLVSTGLHDARRDCMVRPCRRFYHRSPDNKTVDPEEDKEVVVICPKCKTRLKVDEGRLTAEGSRFKCPRCATILLVKKPLPVPEKPVDNVKILVAHSNPARTEEITSLLNNRRLPDDYGD